MNKVCVECDAPFDPYSREKRKVGGLITHCVECSHEGTARYAGVAGADGKQASISILKFQNAVDRERYLQYFKNNSGLYKGKSCQMGKLASTPDIKFQTVAVNLGGVNHKGKA
jgi:hypothetical protein